MTRPDLGATTTSLPGLRPALAAALIGLSTVATAGTVGRGIWQMEDLLRTGRIIYLSMVPVDPRSLMQGDYMALRFALPSTPQVFEALQERTGALSVVATVDARNVATVVSVSNGQPALSSDQVRINLTRKAGQWRLGTDAWFFKEGNGERFAAARFGEFRVGSDGRALLVGLAQADLQPIR